MANNSDTPVKATATSFRVIEGLLELDGAGVSELASHLDLAKSSIHNHLKTLEQLGYVVRDESGSEVSVQFFQLGTRIRARKELYASARGEVDRLSSSSGLNAGLVVEERGVGHCLYSRAGKDVDSVVIEEGEELPLHATGVGKAMLAVFPRKEVEQILDQRGTVPFTDNTIANREEFMEELETIKNHGVAFEEREFRDDVRTIGAAITGKNNRLIGGLFVAGYADTLTGKQLRQNNPGLLISAKNRLGNPAQPPTKE